MPSKSAKQRAYVFHLRGEYKNKANTPEKQKWIWEPSWEKIEESTLQSTIVTKVTKIGNLVLEAGDEIFIEDKQRLEGNIEYNDVQVSKTTGEVK